RSMIEPAQDPIRETIFRVLIDSCLLRPAPVPIQITETGNGRSYRIVPFVILLPDSCLYYASQAERLQRELLSHVYERKAVLDGGIHVKKLSSPLMDLPLSQDRGWLRCNETARARGMIWGKEFRITAAGPEHSN